MSYTNEAVLNAVQKRLEAIGVMITLGQNEVVGLKVELSEAECNLSNLKKEHNDLNRWIGKHYE